MNVNQDQEQTKQKGRRRARWRNDRTKLAGIGLIGGPQASS